MTLYFVGNKNAKKNNSYEAVTNNRAEAERIAAAGNLNVYTKDVRPRRARS
jgi:hypothetical protein